MGTNSEVTTTKVRIHGVEVAQFEASVSENTTGLVVPENTVQGIGLSFFNPQDFNTGNGTIRIQESTALVECGGQTRGVLLTVVSDDIKPTIGKDLLVEFFGHNKIEKSLLKNI